MTLANLPSWMVLLPCEMYVQQEPLLSTALSSRRAFFAHVPKGNYCDSPNADCADSGYAYTWRRGVWAAGVGAYAWSSQENSRSGWVCSSSYNYPNPTNQKLSCRKSKAWQGLRMLRSIMQIHVFPAELLISCKTASKSRSFIQGCRIQHKYVA